MVKRIKSHLTEVDLDPSEYRWIPLTFDEMFGEVMSNVDILKPLLCDIMGLEDAKMTKPEKQHTIAEHKPKKYSLRLDIYTEINGIPVDVELQRQNSKYLGFRARVYTSAMDKHASPSKRKYNIPEVWSIWFNGFEVCEDHEPLLHCQMYTQNHVPIK